VGSEPEGGFDGRAQIERDMASAIADCPPRTVDGDQVAGPGRGDGRERRAWHVDVHVRRRHPVGTLGMLMYALQLEQAGPAFRGHDAG
jgi:hypothetical protein